MEEEGVFGVVWQFKLDGRPCQDLSTPSPSLSSPPSPLDTPLSEIMSVSVDDLIASLSANHIGQEATDLAALQAQLAQTLLAHQLSLNPSHTHTPTFAHGVSVSIARRDPTNVQHCTTPTARTPSSATFTWPLPGSEHVDHSRKRSIHSARRQSVDESWCDFEEMDEERTVEDMVMPDSPRSPSACLWSACRGDAHGPATRVLSSSASNIPSVSSSTESYPSSLFTSTDPFYLQASQPPQPPHASFFSHVGRPSSHSPFLMGVPSWE